MKSAIYVLSILFILLALNSCNEISVEPTSIATLELTKAPTLTPTLTKTPIPTSTRRPTTTQAPTKTPTPTIFVPEVVQKTYSDYKVILKENFEDALSGFPVPDWIGESQDLFVTGEDTLELVGENVGFFTKETISVNEAIVAKFKFTSNSYFTLGLDRIENGERIPFGEPGFQSVSMEFRYTPSANIWNEEDRLQYWFSGDLKLEPDTWYMITIGFTSDKRYIFKVWDPENPEKMLSYQTQYEEMPNQYYFIMWINDGATLYLDEVTVLKFSGLIE